MPKPSRVRTEGKKETKGGRKTAIYLRSATVGAGSKRQRLGRLIDQVPETHVEVFADLGFSGLRADRPAYQRLQAGIVSGQIGIVVVDSSDRISRDGVELERFLGLCLQHGVRLVVAGEKN